MGLPTVDISFKTVAASAIARSKKGVVGLILLDAAAGMAGKAIRLTDPTQISTTLSEANRSYVVKAVYTTAQYCSRIAGLIAGTPMTISCTYAPLPEVSDIKRLTREEMDTAIDAGKLMLYHDGEKVKVARGVTSLVTTTQGKGSAFKKIKTVEAVDMIRHDLTTTCQDSYIGKYANSYDNKCLLISAIKGYFETLELEGILERGSSTVGVDVAAQSAYLTSQGVDVGKMNEQQIKQANTADKVFVACTTKILDAIEDITIGVVI